MDALLLAVLNALWQGAALIALVALALRAGLRRNATTACVVWTITFAVVALLPAIDLVLARPASVAPAAPAIVASGAHREIAAPNATNSVTSVAPAPVAPQAPTDFGDESFAGISQPAGDAIAALNGNVAQRVGDGALRLGGAATAFARAWGIALIALWAFVAGGLLLRLAAAYAAIARMKRDATPIHDPVILDRLEAAGHRRRATVARSQLVEIPCAVGFTRPMILIPARLASSLDSDDLARVVLHESAHLQRYDDWTNALEQVVCALQFFQPALYVARQSIDFEREVACDDRVLEDVGEPLRYAECLARIVQRHVRGRQAAVVPGFVLRRPQVVARVRRIVDRSRDASPQLRLGAAILGGGVMIATLGIARLQVPVVAPAAAAVAPVTVVAPVTAVAPVAAKRPATAVAPVAAKQAVRASRAAATVVAAADPSPTPSASPAPSPSPYVRALRAAQALHTHVHVHVRGRNDAASARVAPLARVLPLAPLARVAPLAPLVRVAPLARIAPRADMTSSDEGASTVRVAPVVARVRSVVANAASMAALTAPVAASVAVRVSVQTVAQAGAEAPRAPAAPVRARHADGDLLDAIDEAKYPHPSVDDLIALRNQGVSADYVRRMGALGRGRPSLHELMALAVQGVTPEYVGTLDNRLASHPSLDEIIGLRVQGVSAAWLDGLAAIGYPKLSAGDAISLAVQGVSVSYVRGLLDAGLRTVTPQQLVSLRVQGIDGAFVRRLAAHNYRNLSVDELVRLKVSGFEP